MRLKIERTSSSAVDFDPKALVGVDLLKKQSTRFAIVMYRSRLLGISDIED